MQKTIGGIQQVGIGIPNVHEAWAWYKKHLSVDIKAFDDEGMAELMLPYTDGKPQSRHAILALNLRGGGGFEIWQYKSRTPEAAPFKVALGDLGIFAVKIKSDNISESYRYFESQKIKISKRIYEGTDGNKHFFIEDPYGNIFQIVESDDWFSKNSCNTGGVAGVIIGVSDIEKSMDFYRNILEYDKVLYDINGKFDEFSLLEGGNDTFRRVLITHSKKRIGAFSKLLGNSTIELIQVKDRPIKKIFENRLWGDLGFIHLCYDVMGIEQFDKDCKAEGHPFTVDSRENGNTFDMGDAAGSFAYIEDPDGTLIELVETHKLPIIDKINWSVKLKNRTKPLPDWILKLLRFKRQK